MITTIISIVFVAVIYIYHFRAFKYWQQKGVKHDKPVFLFGNNIKGYLMQRSRVQMAAEMYDKYPQEKVVGFYRGTQPELIIRDPELVKRVLITDFMSFFYRGFNPNKKVLEPVLRNLFAAEGDLWKMLRTRMTPAFTSAKLKGMFPLIIERAEKLQDRALDAAALGKPLDSRELMARYTTDFIGACAFGIDSDSLNDEKSHFRRLGRRIFDVDFKDFIVAYLKETFPELCKNLKYYSKIENDAKRLTMELQKARNYEPSGRNDFLDMLLDFKKQGAVEIESIEKMKADGTSEHLVMEFDDNIFMGQIIVFFGAGFETSSNSTSMTLHLLAYNPEVQKKVQENIDQALAEHNNKLSYDSVKAMTYLEMAFKEAMRIFPALGHITRKCSRNYTFENLGFTVNEGVKVTIPIQSLHMDPKYWDKPEEFRPERFHPDNINEIPKDTYLAFGAGPRNCIGSRLGMMQSLAGLAAILSKFTVRPAPETVRHPKVNPLSEIVQGVVGGMPLMFHVRE